MKTFVLSLLILFPLCLGGRERDSLPAENASHRLSSRVNIEAAIETTANTDYTITRNGNTWEQGRLQEMRKARMRASVAVWQKSGLKLSAGGYYSYHSIDASGLTLNNPFRQIDLGREHHLWGLRVNASYFGRWAGHTFIANANIMSDFSEYGFEKITGFILAMTPIKQTGKTYFGIGLIGLINTASSWPVFPFFTFRHTMSNNWSIEIMPPQFYVKYRFNDNKSHLSAGMSIDAERFYVRPGIEDMPRECLYSRSFLRPEIAYDRNLSPRVSMKISGGWSMLMSGYIYSHSGHRKHAKVKQDAAPFVNMTFTCNL